MAKRKRKYEYHSPESEAKAKANLPQYKTKTREEIEKEAREFQSKRKKLKDSNIIEFATDKDYLGLSFKERPAQEVILRVLYGLPLSKDQEDIYLILTKSKGGRYVPGQVLSEAVLALGARAGKSFIASICALYEATRGTYKQYLDKGEYCYIVIIATRELQARKIIQENCLRMLNNSPVLQKWVIKETDLEITLKNNIRIISGPCTSYSMRGLPIAVLILEEIAFFRIEGVKSDEIIYNSLRPRQAQFPNNKLFLISTAGAKQGLFFNFFNEGFRIKDRLTCQASTSFVNPLIPIAFLEKEKLRDIDNYNREFNAEFSEKLESFFPFELTQIPFVLAGDIPYKSGNTYYLGFDQSGLSGRDRFSLSIGHSEKETVIIDIVRSWTTKDLESILKDIKKLKNEYHISTCLVDKYAKGWVENAFKRINLEIEIRPGLAEVYVVMKSLILKNKLNLPDRPDLRNGMKNTLAIYNKSNQLSIYHERGEFGHADELDSCCSAIYAISKKLGGSGVRVRAIGGDEEEDDDGNWVDVGGRSDGLLPESYHQL